MKFGFGNNLRLLEISDIAKGHHLDKADLPRVFKGKACQIDHILTIVITARVDRIQLDRQETSGFCSIDAG